MPHPEAPHRAVLALALAAASTLAPPAVAQDDPRAETGAYLVLRESPDLARLGRVEGLVIAPAGARGAVDLEVWCDALRRARGEVDGEADLDAWLARRAASLELRAGVDALELAFSAPAEHLDDLLDLAVARLATTQLDEEDLAAARARALERLADPARAAPAAVADRVLRGLALGADSPWAREPWPGDVRGAPPVEAPGRADLWIGIAAGAEVTETRARVARALARLEPGRASAAREVPRCVAPAGERLWLVDRPRATRVELRVLLRAPEDRAEARALSLWVASLSHRGNEDPALRSARRRVDGLRFEPLETAHALVPIAWIAAGNAPLERAGEALAALRATVTRDAERRVGGEALRASREELERPLSARDALALELRDLAAGWTPGARAAHLDALRGIDDAAVDRVVRSALPEVADLALVVGPAEALGPSLAELGEVLPHPGPGRDLGTRAGWDLRARLFAAVGGREVWAATRSARLRGRVTQGAQSIELEIWRDLEWPRLWLRQSAAGSASEIVVGRDAGWTRVGQEVIELPDAQRARALVRERNQLTRVLHELAAGAPLTVSVGPEGRLEIGAGRCWIELDEAGLPRRLGWESGRDEGGLSVFSDWREADGLRWPARVEQPRSGAVFEWSELEPNAELDPALLRRP